jgi:ABC-type transporter Mla subunit MlaD
MREAELGPLTDRADRTLGALIADGGGDLDAALARLPRPLAQLDAGGELVTRTIGRLDSLAIELRPAAIELAPLLRDVQPLLREITPLARRARPMVAHLATVLDRLAAAAPELREVLEVLDPAMRRLDESVLPFLNADSRLGQPAYMQLMSGFTAATSALRPYQTAAQGQLGAGHVLRLGAYLDPEGWAGLGLLGTGELRCERIGLGDRALERRLAREGVCG